MNPNLNVDQQESSFFKFGFIFILCTDMTIKRDDFKLSSSLVLCHFYLSNYNVQQRVLFLQKFVTMGVTFEGGDGGLLFRLGRKNFFYFAFSSLVSHCDI